MKRTRTFALCCALLILLTAAAAAESGSVSSFRDMVNYEKKPFTFRNGVTWGMNPQQVSVIENTVMEQYSSNEWSVLMTANPVQVSLFSADLVYIFKQNALRMITYEFRTNCSSLNFQYLTGALCSVYGESMEANPAIIKGWMDRVYPNRYKLELIKNGVEWSAEDGTYIYLYYFTEDSKYAILYACPDTGGGTGNYDTNGL